MDEDFREALRETLVTMLVYLIVERSVAVSAGRLELLNYGKVAVFAVLLLFLNLLLRRTNRPLKNLFWNSIYLHTAMTLSKNIS